jgi:hypothetical protein
MGGELGRIAPILLVLGGCSLLPTGEPPQIINQNSITTTLADAYPEYPPLDKADLGAAMPLNSLERDPQGHIILQPGYYQQKVPTY